jgi:hypothetical protein
MRSHPLVSSALLAVALVFVGLPTRTALAQDPLVGTWKIVSWVTEDLETKERKDVFGAHPTGFIIFTPQHRLISLLTGEGRKAPQTDAERAAAFQSMYSLSGKYRIEGGKYIVTVEVAQNPVAIGKELSRDFKISGNQLTITVSAEQGAPTMNGRPARAVTVYERETK